MTSRNDELQCFKTEINLSELAAAYGLDIDPCGTSPNSVAMKHADDEKMILSMDRDVWVYFAVDGGHRGSVIDFIQARRSVNLGQVRKGLCPWLGGCGGAHISPHPTAVRFVPRLETGAAGSNGILGGQPDASGSGPESPGDEP